MVGQPQRMFLWHRETGWSPLEQTARESLSLANSRFWWRQRRKQHRKGSGLPRVRSGLWGAWAVIYDTVLLSNLPPLVSISVAENSWAAALLRLPKQQIHPVPWDWEHLLQPFPVFWHSRALYTVSLKWSQAKPEPRRCWERAPLRLEPRVRSLPWHSSSSTAQFRAEVRQKWSLGEERSSMKAWSSTASSKRWWTKGATQNSVLLRMLWEAEKPWLWV